MTPRMAPAAASRQARPFAPAPARRMSASPPPPAWTCRAGYCGGSALDRPPRWPRHPVGFWCSLHSTFYSPFFTRKLKSLIARTPRHAPKPEMAGGGIDRFGVARGRAITPAIIRRAQMRATLDDLAWNLDVGLTRIVTGILTAATG